MTGAMLASIWFFVGSISLYGLCLEGDLQRLVVDFLPL